MNLAEYRRSITQLADFLPWAALVDEGVVLNKDGSLQRTAKFRGPDLESAVPAGQNLVDLMRISDAVLEAVLVMSGREELVINNRLLCSRHILVHMLDLVGDLQRVSARPHINGVKEQQSAPHQVSAKNRVD